MTTREQVADFVSQRTLALVGMSRGGRKFGNAVYRELTAKGYTVLPVHPSAASIDGARCWPDLASVPGPVGGVIVVVPPAETERVVQNALDAGITRVWMQQGAASPAAVRACEARGVHPVHGECILMFAEPLGWFHGAHRGLWRWLGKLPS